MMARPRRSAVDTCCVDTSRNGAGATQLFAELELGAERPEGMELESAGRGTYKSSWSQKVSKVEIAVYQADAVGVREVRGVGAN